jgi:copper chaperone
MAEEQHEYKFNITMSCGGCSGAVDRVLKKLDGKPNSLHSLSTANPNSQITILKIIIKIGVKSYTVSLDDQTATVQADESLPYDKVLQTIKKTGKTVNSGLADGVTMGV